MSRVLGVIPARFDSTRFPGKPLADLAGSPMIEHVWRRASECDQLDRLVVATDDKRIFDAAVAFGAEASMTSASCVGVAANVVSGVDPSVRAPAAPSVNWRRLSIVSFPGFSSLPE